MMLEIKFSHNYPKLHNQKTAKLLMVSTLYRKDLTDKFIEYDTVYGPDELDRFLLVEGSYMVLTFSGDEMIPFTTVRRMTYEKHKYYTGNIGKDFKIVVKEEQ